MRADPLADDVMAAFAGLPPGRGFALLEQALRHGIASVPQAPPALQALFAALDQVPAWVDRARQDRGGAVVLRAGLAAGVVLGFRSLVLGYASPGGNKPLVFSGRLRQQAPRRLSETSRFVQAVCQPAGLHRFAPGFAITVKVRLMHAQVRRLIGRSQRWRPELWGLPINQYDMLATVLLFSVALIEGLRTLGYAVSDAEADDLCHTFRHVGLLMGVEPALLPTSFAQGGATAAAIRASEGPPDDDARALVAALFEARVNALVASTGDRKVALRHQTAMHAVCRLLLGEAMADALALPRPRFAGLARLVRPAARLASQVNRLPLVRDWALAAGDRYWDAAVAEGRGEGSATYAPPDQLAS
jgi:hypothetical protein